MYIDQSSYPIVSTSSPGSGLRAARAAVLALALAGALLSVQGCMHGHYNDEWVDWRDLDFSGYAENPSATIQIQAFDQSTSTWRVVASATSSASPTHYGDRDLYAWSRLNFNFTTVPNAACYWGYNGFCSIPAGSASAKFRFKEVGSSVSFMTTFEESGVSCVIDEVSAGTDWITAGNTCRSAESPVLTLRMLT